MRYLILRIFLYLAMEKTFKIALGDQLSHNSFRSFLKGLTHSDYSNDPPFLMELQDYCFVHQSLSVPVPGNLITMNLSDIDLCSMTIEIRNVSRVEINFIQFNIDFKIDYFAILNGEDGDVLRKYYGNKLPPPFVTSSNYLTVEFQKISPYNLKKYVELEFFSTDKNASELNIINTEYCDSNGSTIESHNFTNGNYSHNMEKVWNLRTIPGHVIYFIGYNFSTEEHYDILQVGKGRYPENKASIFYEISGQNDFVFISTYFTEIWLLFKTDETINSNGFSLNINFQKRVYENYYLNQTKGVITTANFPHYYLPNQRIAWYIELQKNQIIQLTIHTLDLNVEANDYIVIGYGHLLMKGEFFPLTEKITETPRKFVSDSNKAYIYFLSNAPINPRAGFNITWRPVTENLGPYPATTVSMSSTDMTSQDPSYQQMMNTIKIRLHITYNITDEKFMADFKKNMSEFVTDFCLETEDYCLTVEIVKPEYIVVVNISQDEILPGFLLQFFVKSEDPEEVVMSNNQLEEMIIFYSSINFLSTRFGYNITIDEIEKSHQDWLYPSIVILTTSFIIYSVIYCYCDFFSNRFKGKKKKEAETSAAEENIDKKPNYKLNKTNPIFGRTSLISNIENDEFENDKKHLVNESQKEKRKLPFFNSKRNKTKGAFLKSGVNEGKEFLYKKHITANESFDNSDISKPINLIFSTNTLALPQTIKEENSPDVQHFISSDLIELENFTINNTKDHSYFNDQNTFIENTEKGLPLDFAATNEGQNFGNQTMFLTTIRNNSSKIEDTQIIGNDMNSSSINLLISTQSGDQGHSNPAYIEEDEDDLDFHL